MCTAEAESGAVAGYYEEPISWRRAVQLHRSCATFILCEDEAPQTVANPSHVHTKPSADVNALKLPRSLRNNATITMSLSLHQSGAPLSVAPVRGLALPVAGTATMKGSVVSGGHGAARYAHDIKFSPRLLYRYIYGGPT